MSKRSVAIQSGPTIWFTFTLYAMARYSRRGMKLHRSCAPSMCSPRAAWFGIWDGEGLIDATSNSGRGGLGWAHNEIPASRTVADRRMPLISFSYDTAADL